MKNVRFSAALLPVMLLALVSCTGGSSNKKSIMTPTATGAPYEMLVVADPEDFQNGVYDALHEVLTDDIPGLPQSEEFFKVSKTTSRDFTRSHRYCRNIIIVKIDRMFTQAKYKFSRDVYASPQIVMTIQAPDIAGFKKFLEKSGGSILTFFDKVEINREVEHLKRSHHPVIEEKVQDIFGCDVYVPEDLRRMKTARNFLWASTDRGERDMNFVIYSYPYTDANTFTAEYFFDKRDSVMQRNIPGPREGQYMTTTREFVKVRDAEVKGKYAQIARGLWDMKNYDMGGPFVSISRVDEKNQRVIVVEGFVYAPGDSKKGLMRRMEASLYTLRLPDEIDEDTNNFKLEEITINPDDE